MSTMIQTVPAVKPANPRDSWPAWTDEERWTITPADDDLAGEPMDGRDDEPFAPTKEQEARHLGYTLGLAGERGYLKSSTPGWDRDAAWAFTLGQIEGHQDRIEAEFRADREFEAWVASMEHDRAGDPIIDADLYRPGATS